MWSRLRRGREFATAQTSKLQPFTAEVALQKLPPTTAPPTPPPTPAGPSPVPSRGNRIRRQPWSLTTSTMRASANGRRASKGRGTGTDPSPPRHVSKRSARHSGGIVLSSNARPARRHGYRPSVSGEQPRDRKNARGAVRARWCTGAGGESLGIGASTVWDSGVAEPGPVRRADGEVGAAVGLFPQPGNPRVRTGPGPAVRLRGSRRRRSRR